MLSRECDRNALHDTEKNTSLTTTVTDDDGNFGQNLWLIFDTFKWIQKERTSKQNDAYKHITSHLQNKNDSSYMVSH